MYAPPWPGCPSWRDHSRAGPAASACPPSNNASKTIIEILFMGDISKTRLLSILIVF
jgi:hypothetical protein